MTFEDIVDQALEMVRRRGQVSYRMIKRQFDLDDDVLEDLKEELLYAQPQVIDDEGKGLLWTGETAITPTMTSHPTPPEPHPVVAQSQPAHVETPPAEPRPQDAERRQLTVMFCDLVGSTHLSGQLDPEALRDVIRAYQAACHDVMQRFEGYVAQHLGDGLLMYFGYPEAHEDDAQRAVRTGLGIIDAIRTLNHRVEQTHGMQLAVRIGIHTGLVVIGEIGAGVRHEQLALGETPNLAARLQGLAAPDTVVISAATYRLIQGYFDCDSLGAHELRGVSQTIVVYRVVQASGAQSRLDIASARGLTPLVGREAEVTLLQERWEQAQDGQGQVVLLRGEAGIGKSRLVQVLKDHAKDEPHAQLECRCLPYHTNSAFYPLAELLQRKLAWQPEDTADEKLHKLETVLAQTHLDVNTAVPLFTALLSLPLPDNRYSPIQLSSQQQRQQTLEAFLQIVLLASEQHPVLLMVEDLHWVDPSTLEFLELLIDQTPMTAIFVLFTSRSEFQPTWPHRSYLTEVSLSQLSRHQVEQMATQVASGKALPADVIEQLVDKSDGVPLYVEEMTKAVLESGVLKETNGQYERAGSLALVSIPATLQDSLMARLDRLVTAKAVAQSAAVLGRHFTYELLSRVSPLDAATLQHELARLVEAEIVYQRGMPPQATYTFKHALIQDAAYESLLRSTRQQYHQRIAQVLEAQFPDFIETQPELLAHHYTEAGLKEQAVVYWQRAGQQASERSANLEAISHFTTGIELLKTLPETPDHIQQALILHIVLGAALLLTKGQAAPEVEHTYTQARMLCQQVGETPELVPVLYGLWRFYVVQRQFQMAQDLGETLLHLAQHVDDPALAVIAHYALGSTSLWRGALPAARQHLAEAIAHHTTDQRHLMVFRIGQDPGVACRICTAFILWLLGYPDQALARLREALTLAHTLRHPFSLAYARCWAAIIYQWCQDAPAVHEQADAAVALATVQDFPLWAAQGMCLRGWALAMQGQGEEGMAQVCQGIAAWRAAGAVLHLPYLCTVLADVSTHLGHPEDGLQALAEAHTIVKQYEDRWWEAEIYRLRGVLLLRQPGTPQGEAETWLQRALDVARRQEAKSLELRAAMSLAKLWQSQDKRQESYDLLAPVYGWFTEGFDTADLQEAKELLEELA